LIIERGVMYQYSNSTSGQNYKAAVFGCQSIIHTYYYRGLILSIHFFHLWLFSKLLSQINLR
ncbi:MAG: hypothetical protein ACLRH4_16290, partial [Anaerobutyricum hallii]